MVRSVNLSLIFFFRKTSDCLTRCSSVEAACQSEEPFTAESFCMAANQSPSWLKRFRLVFIWVSRTEIHFVFDMKASLWTVAEEGCGFYRGHQSFHDGGGAADFRGGSQGDRERQTRYTHTNMQPECACVCGCVCILYLWLLSPLSKPLHHD